MPNTPHELGHLHERPNSHPRQADQLLTLMETAWQCRPEVLQKIGALTLAWAVLDNALEPSIWMLGEIDISNIKHDSVSGGSETRLRLFGEAAKRFPDNDWHRGVEAFLLMAGAVLIYRNAIAHGVPTAGGASINNAVKRGEVRRKPPSIALLSDAVLDGVLAMTAVFIQFILELLEEGGRNGPLAATQWPPARRHLRRLQESRSYAAMVLDVANQV